MQIIYIANKEKMYVYIYRNNSEKGKHGDAHILILKSKRN